MNCNCEDIYPCKDVERWESCPASIIADADNYYTKHQVDELIESASGCCITPEEVDEKIEEAVSGKQDTLIAGSGITISGNVISADGADLSNYYTKSETSGKTEIANALNSLDNKKLDASAYTPTDLSNYYTKSETSGKTELSTAFNNKQDKLIAGANITISGNVISAAGGSEPIIIDPTLSSGSSNPVANSAITNALDDKLDVTAYTPVDLSAYATKQWVLNKNYVTNSTLIQYITNLQNQITSLEVAISGCCSSSGTVETRWVTMTGASDYVCSGTTKMSKEQEEQSTDGGVTWTPTGNYRTGSTVLEYNSEDCGYVPQGTKLTLVYSDLSTYEVPCDETGIICSGVSYDAVTKEMVGSGNQSISNIVSATIGDCANGIMHDAFSGCTNLQKVNLPNNFSDAFSTCHGIDVNAFENTNIRTIGLVGSGADIEYNENMIRLASQVFANCRNLTRVELPYTFTEFAPNVFSGCSNLNTIIINSTTIPILNNRAQSQYPYDGLSNIGNNTFKIYVPDNLVDDYKNSRTSQQTVGYRDWGNYADHIYPISELNS